MIHEVVGKYQALGLCQLAPSGSLNVDFKLYKPLLPQVTCPYLSEIVHHIQDSSNEARRLHFRTVADVFTEFCTQAATPEVG